MMTRSVVVCLALVGACSDDEMTLEQPLRLTSVTPSAVCRLGNEFHTYIEVHGAGFALGDPRDSNQAVELEFEQIGETFDFTPGVGELLIASQNLLVVRYPVSAFVPSIAAPALFDVRVTNPDGQEDILEMGLTHYSGVQLFDVTPLSGTRGSTVPVTLTGNGFYGWMRLRIGSSPIDVDVTVESPTLATAELEVRDSLEPGMYALTLLNAAGCSDTIDSAFEVLEPSAID